ncbi:MAG: hypothetical protein RL173_1249 [Fibrobacterota bacterium]
MIVGFELHYLRILAWTCLLEGMVVFAVLRIGPWKNGTPWWRLLAASILPTCATLPHLWFVVFPLAGGGPYVAMVAEPCIALAESAIIEVVLRIGWRKSLVVSCLANLFSWAVGALWLSP